jgi:hypothetical protein
MENQETLQPRVSLDEKPPVERPESNEKQQNIETLPSGETTTNQTPPPDTPPTEKEKEWEYITGLKLILVLIAVTLACFLMLLDSSILSTVSIEQYPMFQSAYPINRLFLG